MPAWPQCRCRRRCTEPPVGAYSPTSSRATVLLPQPDSPTSASVVPRAIEKLTPSTACTNWRGLPSSTRLQQRRRDVEGLRQVAHLDTSQRRVTRDAFMAVRQQPAGGLRGAGGIRSGRSPRQRSNTCGQRGLKAQPCGMAVRRGIAPSICEQAFAVFVHRRDRAHQAGGVGMRRRMDDVVHRTDLGDAPGIHHRHAVAGLGDHAHVVRDQHHRRAVLLAQALEQRDDLRLDRHVERGGRLVGDDQPGFGSQRQRDHHALAHAARELVRVLVDALLGGRDAGFLEQADRALAGLVRR